MELPFTIVFEPPSRSELRALLRMRGYWAAGFIVALTIGTAYVLANVAHADAVAASGGVSLVVNSEPAGAAVEVDGHPRGPTPLDLTVATGPHRVLLKAGEALDGKYDLDVGADGAELDAVLWRSHPRLTRLRPALPGASLEDVRLLTDGEVGLSIGLPPDHQLQAWRLDPRSGALQQILNNVSGRRLTFADDGRHLAYLGREIGPPFPGTGVLGDSEIAPSVVWLIDSAGNPPLPAGWRAPLDSAEQLTDVSWSPHLDQLLVVSEQRLPGGAVRSRLWIVDADGQRGRAVLSLPSEIVPGTAGWSPDAQSVAFVAHAAAVNALCLLRMDGAFRYLADLDSAWTPPLQYPPVVWSADGQRLLFVAPHQHPPGAPLVWLEPDPRHAVYLATTDQASARALGDTDMDLATWREDGRLLGLGRAGADSPLSIRLLNEAGGADQPLLDLPLKPDGRYAAEWDLRQARLLVASQSSSGAIDYWLAMLGLDGEV